MVWTHKAPMHWATEEVKGLILEVKIVKGSSHMRGINAETGEVIAESKHNHPITAMEAAKALGVSFGKQEVASR